MKRFFLVALLALFANSLALAQTAEGHLEKGHAFWAHGKHLQAEGQYLRALEFNPQLGAAHARLGEIYQGRHQYAEAVAHYRKALEGQFNPPEIYTRLALCLQKRGHIDQAIETYHALIMMYPRFAEAYLGLGGLYDAQENKQMAEDAYARYRLLKP